MSLGGRLVELIEEHRFAIAALDRAEDTERRPGADENAVLPTQLDFFVTRRVVRLFAAQDAVIGVGLGAGDGRGRKIEPRAKSGVFGKFSSYCLNSPRN